METIKATREENRVLNAGRFFRVPSLAAQWAIYCAGLLALTSIIGLNIYFERGTVENYEIKLLEIQTDIVQKIFDQDIIALNTVLEDLRITAFPIPDTKMVDQRLRILTSALTGVRTLSFYDARGTVVASSRPELIGRNFAHRDYFTDMKQGGDAGTLYLSRPFKSVLGPWVIVAGRIIVGPEGKFAGIVNATLDPGFFKPLLRAMLYAPDMWVNLAHAGGTSFLMVPPRDNAEGADLAKPGSFFTRHMQSGRDRNVFQGRASLTGDHRLLVVHTIHPAGVPMNVPLVIGVSRDTHVIYGDWRRNAWLKGGGGLLVALAFALVLLSVQRWRYKSDAEMARAAEELARRDHFLRMVMDNVPAMVAYWNAENRCEYANKAYQEWFGKTWDQMEGIDIHELLGDALYAENEARIRGALRGEAQVFEQGRTRADGAIGHTLVRYVPDSVEDGVRGVFVLVSDVTELIVTRHELERRVEELHLLATKDALTGISNRRHFLEQASMELVRAKRYGKPFALLMLDVDHFKAVNDTHGHDVGDEVLRSLGAELQGTVRTSDHVGRIGGEEFAALIIEADIENAREVAERLRQKLYSSCIDTRTGPVSYTVSIGLAEYQREDDSVDDMLRRADLALYHAKRNGRNRVCCYGEF